MKVTLKQAQLEKVVENALLHQAMHIYLTAETFTVEVEKWTDFLSIYWKACGEVTRLYNWRLALHKRDVVVELNDGRSFETWVQMRVDEKDEWGLWYGVAVEE